MNQVRIEIEHGSCLCTFYNNGKAEVMIIDNVFVNEGQRGKGVGTRLFEKALELAKKHKVDSVELNANIDNIPAKKLYEKMGFENANKIYYRKILRRK